MFLSWAQYAGRARLAIALAEITSGPCPPKLASTDRAVIAVTGPEARTFLQGLITNDVEAAKPGQPIYAALLTPQGKILFDFLIFDRTMAHC